MPRIETVFSFGGSTSSPSSSPGSENASSLPTMIVGTKSVLQQLDLAQLVHGDTPSPDATTTTTTALLSAVLNQCSSSGGTASTFLSLQQQQQQQQQPNKNGDDGSSSVPPLPALQQVYLTTIPETPSRNLHPWSVHAITKSIQSSALVAQRQQQGGCRLIFCGGASSPLPTGALVVATAKAWAVTAYSRKTTTPNETTKDDDDKATAHPYTVHVSFVAVEQPHESTSPTPLNQNQLLRSFATLPVSPRQDEQWQAVCAGIHLAARLVDMPPCELTTTAYAKECAAIVDRLNAKDTSNTPAAAASVTLSETVGDELRDRGYGGLYAVGQAATCPPRLIVLEYTPPSSSSTTPVPLETIALVGKGIVYDTGGLSLKTKDGMPGMKMDMGGSAALLGAFFAAVAMGHEQHRIVLVLCVAENAIGPTAFRNDDILTMYSNKTVEINNTDAEGRLVLADGVAHATRHCHNPVLVVDMATLTGAQLVTTGRTFGAVLANGEDWQARAVAAGKASGDLLWPLLYAPELLLSEFDSKVADMKNSVKDRSNAQSSCAGHFIEAHIHPDYKGGWIHIDMAGPVERDGRGTGYGVGLVLALLNVPGFLE